MWVGRFSSHFVAISSVSVTSAGPPEWTVKHHTITTVPNATTFKYALADNPNPPNQSGSSPSGYYGRLWQAGRVVIEDNVIELIPTPTNYGPPIAIELDYVISGIERDA